MGIRERDETCLFSEKLRLFICKYGGDLGHTNQTAYKSYVNFCPGLHWLLLGFCKIYNFGKNLLSQKS